MILTLFYHCSEEERVSAYDIASKRSNWQRAGGWKLQRFALQLDEMVCSSLFLLTICKFITLLRLSSPLPLFFPLHSYTLAPFFSPPCFLCLPSSFLLLPSLPLLSLPSLPPPTNSLRLKGIFQRQWRDFRAVSTTQGSVGPATRTLPVTRTTHSS